MQQCDHRTSADGGLRLLAVGCCIAVCIFQVDVGLAQVTGLPVTIVVKELPELKTLRFSADVGIHNDNIGEFRPLGLVVSWSPSRLHVSAAGAALVSKEDESDNGASVGFAAGYDLKPGSSNIREPSIQLKGGVGYTKVGSVKWVNIPVAIGAGMLLPADKVNLMPWVALRTHVRVSDGPIEDKSTDIGGGASFGLAATLWTAAGPGFHIEGDLLRIDGRSEFIISGGLHLEIAFP